jgi:drug/metabolite transporter (DMT)-like permease
VALMSYSYVFYAFLSDYFVFNQKIKGEQLIGAISILSITVIVALYKLLDERQEIKLQ